WRVSLPEGVLSQLTNRPEKAYRPAVSPDGRKVAFLETKGVGTRGAAALRVLELSSNSSSRTLEEGLLAPGAPSWTADVVSLRFHRTAASTTQDMLLTVDIAAGSKNATAAFSSETRSPDEQTIDEALPVL